VIIPRVERSCGGVLCQSRGGSVWVAVIVTRGGTRWQLPKGWIGEGETPQETARREVEEETGLTGRILEDLGTIDYWFYADRNTRVHKFVTFYLMAYEAGDIAGYDATEVDGALWVPMKEAMAEVSFGSERDVLRKAQEVWRQHMSLES